MTTRRLAACALATLALVGCSGTPATTATQPTTTSPATTATSASTQGTSAKASAPASATRTASASTGGPASATASASGSSSAKPSTAAGAALCSPATPRYTPVPTATTDAERATTPLPAFRAYWDAVDDMRNSGGHSTTGLADTAGQAPLEYWTKVATEWQQVGICLEGRYSIVVADPGMVSISADDGRAEIAYCIDTAGAEFRTPPGVEFQRPSQRYRKGTAVMRWMDGRWKLNGGVGQEQNVDAC